MGIYLPNSTDSPEDMLYKHCIDQFDIDHFYRSGRSDTDTGCSDSGQDCRLYCPAGRGFLATLRS